MAGTIVRTTIEEVRRRRASLSKDSPKPKLKAGKSKTKAIDADHTIDVKIIGPPESGKSVAADAIGNALRKAGFDVEIKDETVVPTLLASPDNKYLAKVVVVVTDDGKKKKKK